MLMGLAKDKGKGALHKRPPRRRATFSELISRRRCWLGRGSAVAGRPSCAGGSSLPSSCFLFLSLCVSMCIHTNKHIYICAYVCIYIYIVCVCTHTYIYICLSVCRRHSSIQNLIAKSDKDILPTTNKPRRAPRSQRPAAATQAGRTACKWAPSGSLAPGRPSDKGRLRQASSSAAEN